MEVCFRIRRIADAQYCFLGFGTQSPQCCEFVRLEKEQRFVPWRYEDADEFRSELCGHLHDFKIDYEAELDEFSFGNIQPEDIEVYSKSMERM